MQYLKKRSKHGCMVGWYWLHLFRGSGKDFQVPKIAMVPVTVLLRPFWSCRYLTNKRFVRTTRDWASFGYPPHWIRYTFDQITSNLVFDWSRNGANRTKTFVLGHSWRQNDDHGGGATCLSSNFLYNICKCNVILYWPVIKEVYPEACINL